MATRITYDSDDEEVETLVAIGGHAVASRLSVAVAQLTSQPPPPTSVTLGISSTSPQEPVIVVPNGEMTSIEKFLPYSRITFQCAGIEVDVGRAAEIVWSGAKVTGHRMFYIYALGVFYVPSTVYVTGTLWDGSLAANSNREASKMAAEIVFALASTAVRAGQNEQAAISSAFEMLTHLYKTPTDMATALYHDQIIRRFCGMKVLTDDSTLPENPAAVVKLNQIRQLFVIPPNDKIGARTVDNVKDPGDSNNSYTVVLPPARPTDFTSIDLSARRELPDYIISSPVGDAKEFVFRASSLRAVSNDQRNLGQPTNRPDWHNRIILLGGPTPSNRTVATQFQAVNGYKGRVVFKAAAGDTGQLTFFEELALLDPVAVNNSSTISPSIVVCQRRFAGIKRKGALSAITSSASALVSVGQQLEPVAQFAPLKMTSVLKSRFHAVNFTASTTAAARAIPTSVSYRTASNNSTGVLSSKSATTSTAIVTTVSRTQDDDQGSVWATSTVLDEKQGAPVKKPRGRPRGSLTVNRKPKKEKVVVSVFDDGPAAAVVATVDDSTVKPAPKKRKRVVPELVTVAKKDEVSDSEDNGAAIVLKLKKPRSRDNGGNGHAQVLYTQAGIGSDHDGTRGAVDAAYVYERQSINSSFTAGSATVQSTSSSASNEEFNFMSSNSVAPSSPTFFDTKIKSTASTTKVGFSTPKKLVGMNGATMYEEKAIRVKADIEAPYRSMLLQVVAKPENYGKDIVRFLDRQPALVQYIRSKYRDVDMAYIVFDRTMVPKWTWRVIVDAKDDKSYEHFCVGVNWALNEMFFFQGRQPKFEFCSLPEENYVNNAVSPGVKMVGQALIDQHGVQRTLEWGVQATVPFAKGASLGYYLCDVLVGGVNELEGRAALRMSMMEKPNEAEITDNFVIRDVIVPSIDHKCYATGESQMHQLTSVLGKVNTGDFPNAVICSEYDLDKNGVEVLATRDIAAGEFIVFDYGTTYTDSLIADGVPVLKLGTEVHNPTTLEKASATLPADPDSACVVPLDGFDPVMLKRLLARDSKAAATTSATTTTATSTTSTFTSMLLDDTNEDTL
jgi:hypothetical protein